MPVHRILLQRILQLDDGGSKLPLLVVRTGPLDVVVGLPGVRVFAGHESWQQEQQGDEAGLHQAGCGKSLCELHFTVWMLGLGGFA